MIGASVTKELEKVGIKDSVDIIISLIGFLHQKIEDSNLQFLTSGRMHVNNAANVKSVLEINSKI